MFILQKENVIRIVDSSVKRDRLINVGFALVQTPINIVAKEEEINDSEDKDKPEEKYQNMTYQELQKVAKEKGIEVKRNWKKPELIDAIKITEGDKNGII